MIVCDLCKKEIKPNEKPPKILIHTEYTCRAWQQAEVDMCEDCLRELKGKINQVESEFYLNKLRGG